MLWILQQIYGVIMALVGFLFNIWSAVVNFVMFVYRMFQAVPLYFASMPTWVLPVVTCGFMIGIIMLLLRIR